MTVHTSVYAPPSTVATRPVPAPGGAMDVVYVLCLLQAAFLLLGGLGEQLLMGGNPLYLVLPVAKTVLLLILATKAVKGRRWALIWLIVVQAITLGGFAIQLLAGLLPMVDFTVNLVGLLTNLAMPAAALWLCHHQLRALRRVPFSTEGVNRGPLLTERAPTGTITGELA